MLRRMGLVTALGTSWALSAHADPLPQPHETVVAGVGPLAEGARRGAQAGGGVVLREPLLDVEHRASEHWLRWRYPRARWWQYVGGLACNVASFGIEPAKFWNSGWSGGILFDDPLRDALAAETHEGRQRAADISDVLFPIAQYSAVVDSLVVPLIFDSFNYDVAWQLTVINWQVMGVTLLLSRTAQHIAGRTRPALQECAADPGYDEHCDPTNSGKYASFWSGHVSMAFAGASALCAHHQALPLYGDNEAADVIACVLAEATAATTAVMRVVADRHWTTDVLVGAGVGVGVGYGLPWLLHYQYAQTSTSGTGLLASGTGVIPLASESLAGAAVVGAF